MRERPCVFVAYATRSGASALNVVTAALDADPRTAGADVRFARDLDELVAVLGRVRAEGARALVGWSFYSTDFAAAVDSSTVYVIRCRGPP